MAPIKNILANFPRLNMSILPTPFYRLKKISNLHGINIFCKRDDMTGFGFGGNKTRKLDYLIAEAQIKGFNTLITVGSNQSNFCRIAAAAGKANNLEVHLLLGGAQPVKPTGNLLLSHLFDAKIHHLATEDRDSWEVSAHNLKKELTAKGKKVMHLPFGGSVPIGALGYVHAFFEIMKDCEDNNLKLDAIIHATGSGGTQAGLLVGKAITGWPGKIIGIGVAEKKEIFTKIVFELAQETAALFQTTIKPNDVIVEDSYLGEKYGARTKSAEAAIKLFAEHEGILLDNVYSGKAASGLLDYCTKGKFSKKENICFLHTGGNIELFE